MESMQAIPGQHPVKTGVSPLLLLDHDRGARTTGGDNGPTARLRGFLPDLLGKRGQVSLKHRLHALLSHPLRKFLLLLRNLDDPSSRCLVCVGSGLLP